MPREFQRENLTFGIEGLNLQRSLDKLSLGMASRLTNLIWLEDGGITVRPGLTTIITSSVLTAIHTIVRLNDDAGAAYLGMVVGAERPRGFRFIGSRGVLYLANGPTITQVDAGYSGNPLVTIPYRPTLSAAPWLIIGDTVQMRKVRPLSPTTALALPLGLPPPTNPDSVLEHDELPLMIGFRGGASFALNDRDRVRFVNGAEFDVTIGATGASTVGSYLFSLETQRRTTIDTFDSAAGWTANAGTGAGPPVIVADAADKKEGAASLKVTTVAPGTGYFSFINKALVVDLSKIALGFPATDFDQIHFWAKLDRPDVVDEVRIYFILSNFSATTVPGATAGFNDNAYVGVFRPSDFTAFIEVTQTQLGGSGTHNTNTQTNQQAAGGQNQAAQLSPGRDVWTEFGVVDVPVLRGDPESNPAIDFSRVFAGFKRIGADAALDWSNVIGMCIVLKITSAQAVVLHIDDLFLYGAAGQDSSFPGNAKYNYRYRNFDPRTGAKSNPTDTSPEELWLESVRTAIRVTPVPFGDPAIRQQFFRQGGALVNTWYFAGVNGADGGAFVDDASDLSLINAELIQFDNDQPVTTVNEAGQTVFAQSLPVIFGPVDDLIFGLGDPHRRGNIYWCKTGEVDHWPAINTRELSGSSEELIAGCIWRNQPFCASRLRGFVLFPNIAQTGTVNYAPLAMTRGPVNRFCWVPTQRGIVFVGEDGIYITDGGPEVSLTDDSIRPLFHGRTVNEYPPIDTAAVVIDQAPLSPTFPPPVPDIPIRLYSHRDEIWLHYRGLDGRPVQRYYTLIYSFINKTWRFFTWASKQSIEPRVFYSEPTVPATLVVAAKHTNIHLHEGKSVDVDAPVDWVYRSGTLGQGGERSLKEYGDVWIEADRRGDSISLTVLLDVESIVLPNVAIVTGTGKLGYVLDPFGAVVTGAFQAVPGSATAVDISIELSGTTESETPPILYQGGPSYIQHPESTIGRVSSEWDYQGRLTDKLVKGIMIECDTRGQNKTLAIQGDGATALSITVNTSGRKSVQFSWAEFRARMLRFRPTNSVEWVLWQYRWIFDEEPAALVIWESQELNYGIPGWSMTLYAWVTLQSNGPVTLILQAIGERGIVVSTDTQVISDTGSVKQTVLVKFIAAKGVLWKWIFLAGSSACYLYREETKVFVQPWIGGSPQWVQPFGNDDLDGVRGMGDAGLAAQRSGGGGG